MVKVGKYMYHCIRDVYGVLGCVVRPGGGVAVMVAAKVEGKIKDVRLETTRLKNLGGIKYEGDLLSPFVVVRGSAVWKCQHHRFPLWCVIFVSP